MSKISVMIVDDDKMITENIINLFDWEKHGFQIVATAENGKIALSKYYQFHPMLVITDIVMPVADGIDLLKSIYACRTTSNQTKVIMLTSYDEFSYAKKALEYGACDYILKNEITKDFLTEKLLLVKEKIKKDFKFSLLLSQKVIFDLFQNQSSQNSELADEYTTVMLNTDFYYLILEPHYALSLPIEPAKHTHQALEIINLCYNFRSDGIKTECICDILPDHILLIIKNSLSHSLNDRNQALRQYAEAICQAITVRHNLFCSAYFLTNPLKLPELKQKYDLLLRNHYCLTEISGNTIFNINDLPVSQHKIPTVLDKHAFWKTLEENNFAALPKMIDSYHSSLTACSDIIVCLNYIYDSMLQAEQRMQNLVPRTCSYKQPVFWCYNDIFLWLKEYAVQLNTLFIQYENIKYSPPVKQTLQFIDKNYPKKELSISAIADHVYLSPSYLSSLFKKEIGQTINEYITEVRISKARELLSDKKYKIYQIASLVGYMSSKYFSTVFYSVQGVTPKEYRRSVI